MEHVCEEEAACVCAHSWCLCVRPNAPPPPSRAHAGVQTSVLEPCLCNRACVFRPFLLTVESRQLPGGARVCSVMKAFLISGLGCSAHASQLETAEINTRCPVARSPAVTSLTHTRPSQGCCWPLLTPGLFFNLYSCITYNSSKRMIPPQ